MHFRFFAQNRWREQNITRVRTLYLASTLSRMATNRFFSFVMNDGA